MDVRVGLWRRLSAEELMLLNCGVREDSWESLGLQGDPTSPFWRRWALGFFLEEMMLELKIQYFGHLMRRVDSLEKTLMLVGIADRRRRRQQRMRWLDGISVSMDVSLREFLVLVMNREAWRAAIHGVSKSRTLLKDWTGLNWTEHYIYSHTLLKLMSIESVMSSNHVILCHSLLLLPSVFPHISVFSSQPALLIRYQNFGGSDSACLPINIWGWFPLGLTGLMSLQSKVLSRFFPSTTIQKHQFLSSQPSFWSKSHICTWLLEETWFWLYGPLLAQWCLCIKYYV